MTSETVTSENGRRSDASPLAIGCDRPAGQGVDRRACPPTARESELIALIARGLPNKVIAYEMGISPYTVRAHIGNIMRKYQLHNRTQIAMLLTPLLTIAANRRLCGHRSTWGRPGTGDTIAEEPGSGAELYNDLQAAGPTIEGGGRD